jgi:hypothetical protein
MLNCWQSIGAQYKEMQNKNTKRNTPEEKVPVDDSHTVRDSTVGPQSASCLDTKYWVWETNIWKSSRRGTGGS